MRRFVRQARLIGRDAQARIQQAELAVGSGFAGWVAARYVEGAGATVVTSSQPVAADPRFADMHPVAREAACGAYQALVLLRPFL